VYGCELQCNIRVNDFVFINGFSHIACACMVVNYNAIFVLMTPCFMAEEFTPSLEIAFTTHCYLLPLLSQCMSFGKGDF